MKKGTQIQFPGEKWRGNIFYYVHFESYIPGVNHYNSDLHVKSEENSLKNEGMNPH